MSLRERVQKVIETGAEDEVEKLVASDSRSVRYFLGLSYRPEHESRGLAARAMAAAARHHPDLSQEMIRRLIWAMNDDSGTNALSATEVVQAVADERPELLIPLMADIIRLSLDDGLRDGLLRAACTVRSRCPDRISRDIDAALDEQLRQGDDNE